MVVKAHLLALAAQNEGTGAEGGSGASESIATNNDGGRTRTARAKESESAYTTLNTFEAVGNPDIKFIRFGKALISMHDRSNRSTKCFTGSEAVTRECTLNFSRLVLSCTTA